MYSPKKLQKTKTFINNNYNSILNRALVPSLVQKGGYKMAKDVSNKTVVILIILLLIVSLVGFWIVSSKIDDVRLYPMPLVDKDAEAGPDSNDTGTIRLQIDGAEKGPAVGETTGMISLTILK